MLAEGLDKKRARLAEGLNGIVVGISVCFASVMLVPGRRSYLKLFSHSAIEVFQHPERRTNSQPQSLIARSANLLPTAIGSQPENFLD